MDSANPTSPEKWFRTGDDVCRSTGKTTYQLVAQCLTQDDAAFMLEAGRTFAETGKTPRQLAEECARLKSILWKAMDIACGDGAVATNRYLQEAFAEDEQGGDHAAGGEQP